MDTVQIFTKKNNQWHGKPLSEEDVKLFREAVERGGLRRPCAHNRRGGIACPCKVNEMCHCLAASDKQCALAREASMVALCLPASMRIR